MTGHIPQCSCSKSPPTTPVKWNEIIYVICLLRSAKPEIPLQLFRNGWMLIRPGYSLRPNRTVCPVVHFCYVSNQTCLKPFTQNAHTFTGCTLVTHLCNHFIFFCSLRKNTRFIN